MKLVSLPAFLRDPAARSLLCYPASELSIERICEIEALEVTGIYSSGPQQINHWHCLGVGYCGLVLLVQCRERLAALKVRRVDAPQGSFDREAQGLAIANRAQVGPQLLAYSPNFLLMDYAVGQPLNEWLIKQPSRDSALSAITHLLQQAFCLDQAGIDHGNLRCVTKHVVVHNNQPTLLDFSSASIYRRPANVTTLTQGLLWGTVIARYLKDLGIVIDQNQCIQQLRTYKRSPTLKNFQHLLSLLG